MSSVAVLTPESFAEHRSGLGDQETRGGVSEDEAYIPTYLEAFPPLPEKGAPGDKSGEPVGAWSKIRPIKSSVITQVFHVPLEERRYKDNSQFGEGEEAKVCLDIMQKTGAHIELSLAKDQGLSIMVTGKLDSVMKARKEIVARLQTQASATVTIPKEHHRFVIGKNGEKLQELELKTATKINIPRPEDPSNQIKITGTKEGIEKARHEILLISAEQEKVAHNRRPQDTTGGGQARLHALIPVEETVLAIVGRGITEAVATGGAGGINDEGLCIPNPPTLFPLPPHPTIFSDSRAADGVSMHFLLSPLPSPQPNPCPFFISDTQELEPSHSEGEEEEDSDDEERPSLDLTLATTSSETDTACTLETKIEEGSARGETPGTSAQEAGWGERIPQVPACQRARSLTSSAAEDSDEDFDGPGYRRRLMAVHYQMLGALESLPESLCTMSRSMEESSSNLAQGFARSLEPILSNMERVVTSISTPVEPTVMQCLMTNVTASIKGLTAALEAQTAAIMALGTTVERGFQGITAVQQPVLQLITRIAEAPPWERGSGSMKEEPAVLSQDDSITARGHPPRPSARSSTEGQQPSTSHAPATGEAPRRSTRKGKGTRPTGTKGMHKGE